MDLIPATPLLSRVEREMVSLTNAELRLAQRLQPLRSQYSVIVIDTPPTFCEPEEYALEIKDLLAQAMKSVDELVTELSNKA